MSKRISIGHSCPQILLILFCLACALSAPASATVSPWIISGTENGSQLSPHLEVWHDATGHKGLESAIRAVENGQYTLAVAGKSTGLKPGAYWGHFALTNPTKQAQTLHFEYVDHQLIYLNAFVEIPNEGYEAVAELAMAKPFDERPIAHHRFVVPVTVAAGETVNVLVQYGSEIKGFIFPDLRVWTPEHLRMMQTKEVGLMSFIIGGLILMALVALTVGIATGDKLFFAYSVYALAKVGMWWTMAGFTHQFFITEQFHWSYISINGALVIASGIWFARMFLHSKTHMPRLDYLLVFMMCTAFVLVLAAMVEQTDFAVILITLLLLLYPIISIAGIMRWFQGAREAGVFAVAWMFLVAGLLTQALRDLGYIEHNVINYYWPSVGSYTEMVVILLAMGIRLSRLRHLKDAAEYRYLLQLESKKTELEALVVERTKDLEQAKSVAEIEARTDPLTGADNRRNFFRRASELLERSERRDAPFSVLMFDLDHFKLINDTYGHHVGDQVLRLFAKTVMVEIREDDIFGRLGGEEFALVLTGADDATLRTAERLREVIDKLRVVSGGDEVSFTTSIGVAHYESDGSIEELLSRADKALYGAKQSGRDRVQLA